MIQFIFILTFFFIDRDVDQKTLPTDAYFLLSTRRALQEVIPVGTSTLVEMPKGLSGSERSGEGNGKKDRIFSHKPVEAAAYGSLREFLVKNRQPGTYHSPSSPLLIMYSLHPQQVYM